MVQQQVLDRVFSALSDSTRRGILARLGEGPATIGELAEPFGMTLTGLKKHVQVLENAGLVARRADPQDRRSVLLEATGAGLALIERMDLQRRESATAMFGHLAESEREDLLRLLSKLCEQEAETD